MSKELIVKEQPFVVGDQLLQENITFRLGEDCGSSTVVLIENIWDDLLSTGTHEYISNDKKNYFYWSVDITDSESANGDYIKINVECPKLTYEKAKELLLGNKKPISDMTDEEIEAMNKKEYTMTKKYGFPFEEFLSKKSDYLNYWLNKFKTTWINSANNNVIQRKEIIFPGTTYVSQKGNVTIDKTVISNNDLGDMTNLLCMF